MERLHVVEPDGWADICSTNFVRLGVTSMQPKFQADLHQVRLTRGVRLTAVSSSGSEVFRSRAMIATDPADDLLFALHGAGQGRVIQDGREARLRRGTATLYDTAFPYKLQFGGFMTERILQVPRHVVDPAGVLTSDLTARVFSDADPRVSSISRIAAGILQNGDGPQFEADLLVELLAAILREPRTTSTLRSPQQLRAEALEVISGRAHDPKTTPATIAAHLHVSLRTLQAAFQGSGRSIAGDIRSEKVRRAVELLRLGIPVREAGYRAGFEDASTFSRATQSIYGLSPSAIRDGPATP